MTPNRIGQVRAAAFDGVADELIIDPPAKP
jgi:hypothetical protein